MVKVELKRAFKSKGFYLSTFIGIILIILSLKEKGFFYPFEETYFYPSSPYDFWIIYTFGSMKNLLTLLLPLTTTLCYASTFLEDKKSGLIKSIYTRISRKKYLRAKYISNFIVSFISISIPLIIHLLFLLMVMPNIKPNIAVYNQTVYQYSILQNIYYSSPIIQILIVTCIFGIFAGIYSSIALAISLKVKNIFVVLVSPFLITFIIDMVMYLSSNAMLSPIKYLNIFSEANLNVVVIEIVMGIILSFGLFYIGGRNEEIL